MQQVLKQTGGWGLEIDKTRRFDTDPFYVYDGQRNNGPIYYSNDPNKWLASGAELNAIAESEYNKLFIELDPDQRDSVYEMYRRKDK